MAERSPCLTRCGFNGCKRFVKVEGEFCFQHIKKRSDEKMPMFKITTGKFVRIEAFPSSLETLKEAEKTLRHLDKRTGKLKDKGYEFIIGGLCEQRAETLVGEKLAASYFIRAENIKEVKG